MRAHIRRRPSHALTQLHRPAPLSVAFVQGLVASGLLAVAQGKGAPCFDKRALRMALQGGASLAAGSVAAQAWRQRGWGRVALAVAVGVASVAAIEKLLKAGKEIVDEQKKT